VVSNEGEVEEEEEPDAPVRVASAQPAQELRKRKIPTGGTIEEPISHQPESASKFRKQESKITYPPKVIKVARRDYELAVPDRAVLSRPPIPVPPPAGLVLKFSWLPFERSGREILALQACGGSFGTPVFVFALHLADNVDLLPASEDEAEKWSFWNFADPTPADSAPGDEEEYPGEQSDLDEDTDAVPELDRVVDNKPENKHLDKRILTLIVTAEVGTTLEHCQSAQQLARAFLDCQLGWLRLLQCDFLHRDISIGNLLLLKKPAVRPPIVSKLPERLCNDSNGSSKLREQHSVASAELLQILADLDLGECTAITMDYDLASQLDSDITGRVFLSGTFEFMSTTLQAALANEDEYRQGSLDDLESFSHVAFWSVLWNVTARGHSKKETNWRNDVRSNGTGARDNVHLQIERLKPSQSGYGALSPLLLELQPLLADWSNMLKKFADDHDRDREVDASYDFEEQIFAVKSVYSYAQLYKKHFVDKLRQEKVPSSS
jgi:hypothetical protein